jgi:hypothetical protein
LPASTATGRDAGSRRPDPVIPRVVGRFTYRGTHHGPLFGIPPTGRPVEMASIDIWRVAGGQFAEHWDELNLLEVFQQLGVIPALGPGGPEQRP